MIERSSVGRRFEDAANFVRAYPRDLPRLRPLLPNIETPVLIIAGKNDPIVPPPNGQLLADHLPHNRYTLLEGGSPHLGGRTRGICQPDRRVAQGRLSVCVNGRS